MSEHYDIGPFTGMRQDLSGWEDYLGRVARGEVAAEGLERLREGLRGLASRDPEGLNRFLGEFLPGGGLAGMTAKQARLSDTARKAAQRRAQAAERLQKPVEWIPPGESQWLLDRGLIPQAMEGHPGIMQSPLERAPPGPKMDLEAVQIPFRSQPNKELIRQQIERGRGAGGEAWYQSTYPIRARMEEIGRPGGPTFDDFVWANAITSPRSPVAVNAPTATALMTLQQRGVPITKENLDALAGEMQERYGSAAKGYFSSDERLRQYTDYLETGMPPEGRTSAEKITAYGEGLRGNLQSIPLDTHELQGLSFGTRAYPYFKQEGIVPAGSYGEFERRYRDLIEQIGLTPASGQASRWIGGGELTGLRTAPGDYLSILENLARYKAQVAGDPTVEGARRQLDRALLGEEPLLPWYGKARMPGTAEGVRSSPAQASNIVSLGSRRQDIGQQTADKARALVAQTGLDLPVDMTPAQVMSFIDHWGQFEAPDRLLGPLRELWRDWDKAQPGSGYR